MGEGIELFSPSALHAFRVFTPRRSSLVARPYTMILILSDNTDPQGPEYLQLMELLARLPNIKTRAHPIQGTDASGTGVYLLGEPKALPFTTRRSLPGSET